MEMYVIDAGKSFFKTKIKGVHKKFPNRIIKNTEGFKSLNPFTKEVVFNGEEYLIGEGLHDVKGNYSSNKITQDNEIIIYTVIAEQVQDNEKMILVTGLPNSHYKQDVVQSVKEKYLGQKEITVNNITKKFTISKVIVIPENMHVGTYAEKNVISFDFGFRNFAYNHIIDSKMQLNLCKNNELGISHFKNMLIDTFSSRFLDLNFNMEIITDEFIKNGLRGHELESKQLIKSVARKYLIQLRKDMESSGIQFNVFDKMVIRGGGTELITIEQLLSVFPNFENRIVKEGGEFRNVDVFEIVAKGVV